MSSKLNINESVFQKDQKIKRRTNFSVRADIVVNQVKKMKRVISENS